MIRNERLTRLVGLSPKVLGSRNVEGCCKHCGESTEPITNEVLTEVQDVVMPVKEVEGYHELCTDCEETLLLTGLLKR